MQKQSWTKDQILHLLEHSNKMVGRSLVVLYKRQTEDEKEQQATKWHNGEGFSALDAGILTNFAEHFLMNGKLSDRQLEVARLRLPKYAGQLLDEANKEQ